MIADIDHKVNDFLVHNGFVLHFFPKQLKEAISYINTVTGIYVLHLLQYHSNTYYLGKSIDFSKRYHEHVNKDNLAKFISFKPVIRHNLDAEENKLLNKLAVVAKVKNTLLLDREFLRIMQNTDFTKYVLPILKHYARILCSYSNDFDYIINQNFINFVTIAKNQVPLIEVFNYHNSYYRDYTFRIYLDKKTLDQNVNIEKMGNLLEYIYQVKDIDIVYLELQNSKDIHILFENNIFHNIILPAIIKLIQNSNHYQYTFYKTNYKSNNNLKDEIIGHIY